MSPNQFWSYLHRPRWGYPEGACSQDPPSFQTCRPYLKRYRHPFVCFRCPFWYCLNRLSIYPNRLCLEDLRQNHQDRFPDFPRHRECHSDPCWPNHSSQNQSCRGRSRQSRQIQMPWPAEQETRTTQRRQESFSLCYAFVRRNSKRFDAKKY